MFEITEKYYELKSLILNSTSIEELIKAPLFNLETSISGQHSYNYPAAQKYNQARSLLEDVKSYVAKNQLSPSPSLILKAYISKNDELICFLTNLNICSIEKTKQIQIYGFFGKYSCEDTRSSDFFYLEAGVKLYCRSTPIEIRTINAGKEKRLGRGTLGLKFLEEKVIPSVNNLLLNLGHPEPIGYIYGISADLSDDTRALDRAKFYCRNGFTMSNSHFYKYLK